MPTTETEWREVAEQFEQRRNFPYCVGSCDGKHVAIQKPHESGSLFYNYKGFYSIVLFAVVNADYEFMYINTGTNGSVADASILSCTPFYQKMIKDDLNLPPPSALPGTDTVVPYVFLGDNAFALNKNFMKPFPFKNINYEQRVYNYRLSRARRVVENAFGILASRFRVLRRPLDVDLDTVDAIVMACCALHNYLRKHETVYISPNNVDRENITSATFHQGDWRSTTDGLTPLQHRNNSQRNVEAVAVRDKFKNYFTTEGRVGFQDRMINVVPV